jgi:hypothetical protein
MSSGDPPIDMFGVASARISKREAAETVRQRELLMIAAKNIKDCQLKKKEFKEKSLNNFIGKNPDEYKEICEFLCLRDVTRDSWVLAIYNACLAEEDEELIKIGQIIKENDNKMRREKEDKEREKEEKEKKKEANDKKEVKNESNNKNDDKNNVDKTKKEPTNEDEIVTSDESDDSEESESSDESDSEIEFEDLSMSSIKGDSSSSSSSDDNINNRPIRIKQPKLKPKKRNSKPAKQKTRRSKPSEEDLILEALKSISSAMKEKPQLRIEPLKDSTQNVTSWFKIYELHTKTWSNKERGIEIGKYFEGLALQKYQLLTNDKEKIKKHMIKLLQPSNNLFNIKASFYSAKQLPEENVEKFGLRLLIRLTSMKVHTTSEKRCSRTCQTCLNEDVPSKYKSYY